MIVSTSSASAAVVARTLGGGSGAGRDGSSRPPRLRQERGLRSRSLRGRTLRPRRKSGGKVCRPQGGLPPCSALTLRRRGHLATPEIQHLSCRLCLDRSHLAFCGSSALAASRSHYLVCRTEPCTHEWVLRHQRITHLILDRGCTTVSHHRVNCLCKTAVHQRDRVWSLSYATLRCRPHPPAMATRARSRRIPP